VVNTALRIDTFKALLGHYWTKVVAIVLCGIAMAGYIHSAQWLSRIPLVIATGVGPLMFVASEEFSDIMGSSGQFRLFDSSHHFPALIRIGVFVI